MQTLSAKPALERKPRKPRKPKDFPLFVHQTNGGTWAKKVKGVHRYFGLVRDDPAGEKALNQWLDQKDDLLAGREPRPKDDTAATVKFVCDSFLEFKEGLMDSGELAPRTFERYKQTAEMLAKHLGRTRLVDDLRPEEFGALRRVMAKRWGSIALRNEIGMVQTIFKFAAENDLIEHPVKFGSGFEKPNAKALRQARQVKGPKLFTPEEFKALLKHADAAMAAMLLLGMNAALGNTDLALLPIKAVDLKAGWLVYPRHKTAIARRIPLWPETVKAIKAYLAVRPTPTDEADSGLLFIGARGVSYLGDHRGYRVTRAMSDLCTKANVEGRTFYDLRRTFQTVAEGAHDLGAVQAVMGHAASGADMSAIYRQGVDDERLCGVVNYVREWVYKKKPKPR